MTSTRRSNRSLLMLLFVALLLSSCVPSEPDNDEFKKFNAATTVMGRLQEAGTLKIGLPSDRRAFASVDSTCTTNVPCSGVQGFTAELASEVAKALRVEMEIHVAPNDSLIALVDDGSVDLAFPMVPITEELVRENSFTDPFIVGHQRVLAPLEGSDEAEDFELDDLAGQRVCEAVYPDIGVSVASLVDDVQVQSVDDPDACGAAFIRGLAEAAVGPDLALAGTIAFLEGTCAAGGGCPGIPPLPRLIGDQLTTEGYGALVPSGEASWRDYVTQVLEESQQEGRWSELYAEWLLPLLGGDVIAPPGMSVEEAAALYPADL